MLAFTKKPGSAALAYLTAGSVWFALATIYGLFSAIHLMAPETFANIPWLVFGRTRPIHINTIIYGFIVQVLIGAALYYVPMLLKTKLWSEKLGWASWALWNIAVVSGPFTFSFAITQAREYTEYIWAFDLCVVGSIVLLIFNGVMTVVNRQENTLYVSVWYFFGTVLWTAGVYPIGNVMWDPNHGALPGLLDSVFLWYYGHNLVGLFLTPLAAGAAYFVIPRIAKAPLYSHTLSLIGFWMLVTLYSHIGGHHILQSPIPNWLKTISVIDSVAMLVPVMTVLMNIWLTARGRFGAVWHDVAGRFVLVGTFWYFVTCTQGPFQSLPSVQQVTHFTNWTIGHAHIAVLGFSGFIGLGAMWHVLPLIVRREIYSRRLVSLQFGLVLIGLSGFFVFLTVAGLIQGQGWLKGDTVYKVLPSIAPYMVGRAMVGLFIIAGAFVGLYNVVMTIRHGKPMAAAGGAAL